MATSTSTKAITALKWTAIGTNVYIWHKWNFSQRRADGKPMSPAELASPAYRAAHYRHQQHMMDHYTLSARNIDAGRWHTLLTSAASHRSFTHLAVNMFMLHEATEIATLLGLGPARIGVLALGSALGGSAGHLIDSCAQIAAGRPERSALGASGVVQGMLVATACRAPLLPMRWMGVLPADYRTLVVGFLAYDLWRLYESRKTGADKDAFRASDGVAYAAHLGGAVFGGVYYLVALRRGMV